MKKINIEKYKWIKSPSKSIYYDGLPEYYCIAGDIMIYIKKGNSIFFKKEHWVLNTSNHSIIACPLYANNFEEIKLLAIKTVKDFYENKIAEYKQIIKYL